VQETQFSFLHFWHVLFKVSENPTSHFVQEPEEHSAQLSVTPEHFTHFDLSEEVP
jgi:hypothetical protein